MDMKSKQTNLKRPEDSRIDSKNLAKCFRCGRNVSTKWNFCPKCGAVISYSQKNEVR